MSLVSRTRCSASERYPLLHWKPDSIVWLSLQSIISLSRSYIVLISRWAGYNGSHPKNFIRVIGRHWDHVHKMHVFNPCAVADLDTATPVIALRLSASTGSCRPEWWTRILSRVTWLGLLVTGYSSIAQSYDPPSDQEGAAAALTMWRLVPVHSGFCVFCLLKSHRSRWRWPSLVWHAAVHPE